MNETQYITKRLRPFLKERGFAVVHKSSERFSSGWPDLTCVHAPDGETVFIEAKVDGKKPTPLQRKTLQDLAKAGARAFVFTWHNEGQYQLIERMTEEGVFECYDVGFEDTFRKEGE